ncbi:hypothetical protein Q5741_14470 [Paenibacillus sp. JX-17]|uniref:DUF2834 domain-containing protein n=1 Tax=Paenibacillus lacisoli TaxID=3064525 RepID=A0ABT9CEC3_9BACL|nr:hypothetical protein [Paenibacillus sp. JX-17]MDO7907611.1 hypothetical protein [Paenibacillus sp. JX-17]
MARAGWLIVWIAFIVYALLLAPDGRGEDPIFLDLIQLRSTEPSLLAMFSLLGLYPLAYACLLLRSDVRRVPAWPFVIAAFALGAFALIPYYILNRNDIRSYRDSRAPQWILRLVRSPIVLVLLLLGTLAVMGYGLLNGHAEEYREAFGSSRFVNVMTIDFVVLTLLSVYAIYRDEDRPPLHAGVAWIGILPIVGLLVYIWLTRHKARMA